MESNQAVINRMDSSTQHYHKKGCSSYHQQLCQGRHLSNRQALTSGESPSGCLGLALGFDDGSALVALLVVEQAGALGSQGDTSIRDRDLVLGALLVGRVVADRFTTGIGVAEGETLILDPGGDDLGIKRLRAARTALAADGVVNVLVLAGSVKVVEAGLSVELHLGDLGEVEVAGLVLGVEADSLASARAGRETFAHGTLSLGLLVPRCIRSSDVAIATTDTLGGRLKGASAVEVVEGGRSVELHLGDLGSVEVASVVLGVEADGLASARAGSNALPDGALGLGLLVPRGVGSGHIAVAATDHGRGDLVELTGLSGAWQGVGDGSQNGGEGDERTHRDELGLEDRLY